MTVYLVRHGHAGDRQRWDGPDHLRPLDDKGRVQAEELADLLAGRRIDRIVSSPSVRCVQTLQPLADRSGRKVEEHEALAEGADVEEALRLLRVLAGANAVLCTHGELVPNVLERLGDADGLPLPDGYRYDKGSTWVLEPGRDGRFIRAEHLPPLA